MTYELPAMITIYEDVGEAKVEMPGMALIGSFNVLDASDHGSLAVDGYFQLVVGNDCGFHIT